MKGILLDTHVFLWAVTLDSNLKASTFERMKDPSASLFLSVASAWEIAIKVGIGKLKLDRPVSNLIGSAMVEKGIELLPILDSDVLAYATLPFPNPNHRDPFDRMLVVQASQRGLTLLTSDPELRVYGEFVEPV